MLVVARRALRRLGHGPHDLGSTRRVAQPLQPGGQIAPQLCVILQGERTQRERHGLLEVASVGG